MKKIILLVIGILLASCAPGQNGSVSGNGGIVTLTPCSIPCVFGTTPDITDTTEVSNVIKTPISTATDIKNLIGDGGLISLKPCGPPCFFGITPGVTSYEEANVLIASQEEVFGYCKEIDKSKMAGLRGTSCNTHIWVFYKDNIVERIVFDPSENITVQQVIETYGPPDSLTVYVDSLLEPPIVSSMFLYFEKPQVNLRLGETDGREFTVTSSTHITSITYYSIEEFKEETTLDESLGWLQQWKGYGVYTDKLR